MWHRSALFRLSLGLVCLTISILFGLDLLGLVPISEDPVVERRSRIVEQLAMRTTTDPSRAGLARLRVELDHAVEAEDDVLSVGLRDRYGRLMVASQQHRALWDENVEPGTNLTHIVVELTRGGAPWATLEVRFVEPVSASFVASLWHRPVVRLVLVFGVASFVAYALYLRRTLRHLDPSSVIPPRVQAALDLMSEGVLLVDRGERIVLANRAFAERVGESSEKLVGRKASGLGWLVPGSFEPARSMPWNDALADQSTTTGAALCLRDEDEVRTFMVNGAPVLDGAGKMRGAIASFDDITQLEAKSRELENALALLEKSRDEIRLQNDELRVLARRDPLTGAANRRSFLETGEIEVEAAQRRGDDLCCVMVDIDHFKRVNDDHGHQTGDEVIRAVATALLSQSPDGERVCRYGGEEFCVLLPGMSPEEARSMAERWRRSIGADGFAAVPITASFGLASLREHGADSLYTLVDQADQALYVSKQTGRNRVTGFEQVEGDEDAS